MKPLRRGQLESTVARLRARAHNAMTLLPGDRPAWIVVDLSGSYPARFTRRSFFGLPLPSELGQPEASLEELADDVAALCDATWLEGVALRVGRLAVPQATAFALRGFVHALRRAGKRTVALATQLDWTSYYVASAAHEVVVPASAEVNLLGIGVCTVFVREALARFGLRFEKLAVGAYKNAFDELVADRMSDAQREALAAVLASFEARFVDDVAADRRRPADAIRSALHEGVTSARRALDAGLVDRLAYEDEVLGPRHKSLEASARLLTVRKPAGTRRVAVVSLQGAIVPGRSRRPPVPLPLVGGAVAGAESLVMALRAAGRDPDTAAVVFHVDSGGGSALASDLIAREVERIARDKPVVGVMGGLAASGGYYVLCHATRIVAAPTTLTGSIGVFTGKLLLGDLFERHGMRPEEVSRGRHALLHHPATGLDDEGRALLAAGNDEVYERFVGEVARGRKMSRDAVHAVAQGRVWTGADALARGLVDELGDVETAIERARSIAGLEPGAPTYNVRTPSATLLPGASADAAALAFGPALALLGEPHLLVCPLTLDLTGALGPTATWMA